MSSSSLLTSFVVDKVIVTKFVHFKFYHEKGESVARTFMALMQCRQKYFKASSVRKSAPSGRSVMDKFVTISEKLKHDQQYLGTRAH